MLSSDVLTETTTTGDGDAKDTHSPATSYTVTKGDTDDDVITGVAKYTMKQQMNGLAAGGSVDIGGVTIESAAFKTGTATITVKSDGSAPTITID